MASFSSNSENPKQYFQTNRCFLSRFTLSTLYLYSQCPLLYLSLFLSHTNHGDERETSFPFPALFRRHRCLLRRSSSISDPHPHLPPLPSNPLMAQPSTIPIPIRIHSLSKLAPCGQSLSRPQLIPTLPLPTPPPA